MKIAGLCTPQSLFFCPQKKRECAVHGGREKKTGNDGGAPAVHCSSTNVPARGVVRAGILVVNEWTAPLFPLALPWQRLKEKAVNAGLTEVPG